MQSSTSMTLELFVQGQSSRSSVALESVRRICESELNDGYTLEVIDIHHHPERALAAGIMATPALVRRWPEPVLRTVGRMSEERIRQGLGLDED